jgi:hypothetical protein
VFVLQDGKGHYPCSVEVHDPHDVLLAQAPLPDVDKPPKENQIVMMNAPVFFAAGFGTYRITLRLGNASYHRNFILKPVATT